MVSRRLCGYFLFLAATRFLAVPSGYKLVIACEIHFLCNECHHSLSHLEIIFSMVISTYHGTVVVENCLGNGFQLQAFDS